MNQADVVVANSRVQPSAGDGAARPMVAAANLLLRSRIAVLRWALLVFVGVVALGLWGRRTFTASASFVPQSRRPTSNLTGIAAQLGVALPQADANQSPQFYADLLTSRALLEPLVLSRFSTSTDSGPRSGRLVDLMSASGSTPELRLESAIRRLRGQITVGVSLRTGVVRFSVRADQPGLAKQLADTLFELVNHFNLDRRQTQAAAERRFAEGRLGEVRRALRDAEDREQAFLQRNRDFRNSPMLTFEHDRLSREVAREQALYMTLSEMYEQAKLEEVRDTPVVTVIEAPRIPARPDPRRVLMKGILGLAIGTAVGMIVAFVGASLRPRPTSEADDFAEFEVLRRETLADVRRPWRPLLRLVSRQNGRSRTQQAR